MIIAAAIPVFFLFIFIEAAAVRGFGARGRYRFADAVTDLGCGVTDQVGGAFFKTAKAFAYLWLYANARIWEPPTWAAWLIALVGVDFGYYWWHRASHRVNFIWATHVVHHQSPDYNLAVALRQAVFAGLTSWPFYLWMAVLGVHPLIFGGAAAINLLYQFFIHTEVVDKLPGPIEYVFNTPSHHRVHHGVNARYVDKNYGGILILFDRWFGTFELETEPVTYGTISPYGSWNPLWANLAWWVHLGRVAAQAPRWQDKLWIWFAPPEYEPPGVPAAPKPTDAELRARPVYAVDSPRWWGYIAAQWVPITAATVTVLLLEEGGVDGRIVALAAFALSGLVAHAGLLEGKSWAAPVEGFRLVATSAVAGVAVQAGWVDGSLAAAIVAGSVASMLALGWLARGAQGAPTATA